MNTNNNVIFDSIKEKAEKKEAKIRIVLLCPDDTLLQAAELAKKKNIARFIVIDTKKDKLTGSIFANSQEEAVRKGVDLVISGKADTLAKGLINTSIFLREIINSKLDNQLFTHTSILELKDPKRIFIVSDGTVIPNPTLDQKVIIIKNCIKCASIMGIEYPKIALLSANEFILKGLDSGYDCAVLSKMAERGQICKEPIAAIDGPMSLDTAVSEEAVKKKNISFSFHPPADILIAPNLENGAFLIKSAVYMGGAKVAGLLWGTKLPIILTSRADSEEAKYVSICLCSLLKIVNQN